MKKALLVGINDYPGTFSDLMGCVNDVQNMQDLLTSLFGFTTGDISVLTDRSATTANILEALGMLVYEASPGDVLLFHFSGHGTQVPDTSGDEKDRLDEVICPCDIDWRGNVVRDDDLNRIFDPVPPGVHVEIFLDCCHSGTGLRALGGDYRKNRFLPVPEDLLATCTSTKTFKPIRPSKVQVLWAACRANQYAADSLLNGRYGGAFTTLLCNSIRASGSRAKRSDVLKDVRANLKKGHFKQIPQLETERRLKSKSFLTS